MVMNIQGRPASDLEVTVHVYTSTYGDKGHFALVQNDRVGRDHSAPVDGQILCIFISAVRQVKFHIQLPQKWEYMKCTSKTKIMAK